MAVTYSVAQAFDGADRGLHPFLHQALTLIEQVHTCAMLPRVIFWHISYIVETEYRPTIPPQLIIDTGSHHKLSTVIHGIGHVLDQFAFATGEYGVFETRKLRDPRYTGPLRLWWTAVEMTDTYHTLMYALADPSRLRATINRVEIVPEKADIAYLLDPAEVWARSYVQYIATKTRNPALVGELQTMLNTHAFSLFDQWSTTEFPRIEAAIDVMFATLGWSTP